MSRYIVVVEVKQSHSVIVEANYLSHAEAEAINMVSNQIEDDDARLSVELCSIID